LAACASSSSSQVKDFNIVAYQGEDVFGGKEAKFSQIFRQGKPVVLNFWAGQCPPCRAEMPEFQQVADEYQGKVIFVGIDVGPFTGLGNHDDAQRLLTELGIGYPAAYAVDASPLQPYGVRAMPTTVYLSKTGEIQDTTNGIVREPQLRAELQKLVGS
jgi:thiol-disulfide isomerase/thioredoxin